jgi:hypothetical protein
VTVTVDPKLLGGAAHGVRVTVASAPPLPLVPLIVGGMSAWIDVSELGFDKF